MANVPDEYRSFLRELARESGELILRYHSDPDLAVKMKSDMSPVTLADTEAERLIRERVSEAFPDHGLIGEEFGKERDGATYVWIIDPIDGTKSFTHGVPLWGTLIGLLRDGEPILGCIHQPLLGQYVEGDGSVCRLNGSPIRVSSTPTLKESSICITDIVTCGEFQKEESIRALLKSARLVRTWGDCYGYLLLAQGKIDVMLDPIMNSWDLLPLIPIIQGAGGKISGWDGGPASKATSCVATNGILQDSVLASLS